MVVRDETGASAGTLRLLDRLREYVELAARLRSASPLQLVAHALTTPELSVTSFVAQYQLNEKLQRALLKAGVTPSHPLPADAEARLATALLALAQQTAETPTGSAPPMRRAAVGVASGGGKETGSAARAQAEARVAAAEQAAAAASAELQRVRAALQRQTSALDAQQQTLDQQREALEAATAERDHLARELAISRAQIARGHQDSPPAGRRPVSTPPASTPPPAASAPRSPSAGGDIQPSGMRGGSVRDGMAAAGGGDGAARGGSGGGGARGGLASGVLPRDTPLPRRALYFEPAPSPSPSPQPSPSPSPWR